MEKIINNVYLGDVNAAINLPRMQSKNITHILQVMPRNVQPFHKGVSTILNWLIFPFQHFIYKIIPLADNCDEAILKYLNTSCRFIKNAVEGGGIVLVHCFSGNKASLVVMIAYLMW